MKTKEKCCVDCKHCIVCESNYRCNKVVKRNRISGKYDYGLCENVIDTADCEFEDITKQRFVINIILLIIAICAAFFVGWNVF